MKSTIEALLADYTEEMVVGREARKALAINIQSVMNEKLQELTGMGGIEEVLFTSYHMQWFYKLSKHLGKIHHSNKPSDKDNNANGNR